MKKSNIPSPVAPFIDVRSGNISREWFYFLNNYVFEKLGGGGNETTLPDIETDVSAVTGRVDEAESDIVAIQGVNAAQTALIAGLRSDVDDNTSDIGTLYSTKENVSNKVTSLSGSSTDEEYPSAKLVYDQLSGKQETLESGTNIKTINSESILGSGDIEISGSGLSYSQVLSLVSMRV